MTLKEAAASGRRFRRPSFTAYRDRDGYGFDREGDRVGGSCYHLSIEDAIADDWQIEVLPEPPKCGAKPRGDLDECVLSPPHAEQMHRDSSGREWPAWYAPTPPPSREARRWTLRFHTNGTVCNIEKWTVKCPERHNDGEMVSVAEVLTCECGHEEMKHRYGIGYPICLVCIETRTPCQSFRPAQEKP